MGFWKSHEKRLKMIWEIEKDHKTTILIGTAHFFPYSFKTSLRKSLENVHTAVFEGPLDNANLAKVIKAGTEGRNVCHLFDELDQKTIDGITNALKPPSRGADLFFTMDLWKPRMENPVYDMIKGMDAWLAFFAIWSSYLRKNGWKYSVDMEGYEIAKTMGKKINFLETIDEQINVLKRLSLERILEFLKNVESWSRHAEAYVDSYLEGNLGKMKSMGLTFPSRHQSVIDCRDEIFYDRMRGYLKAGEVAVFVGAPHVRGLSKLLHKDGYRINGPNIS